MANKEIEIAATVRSWTDRSRAIHVRDLLHELVARDMKVRYKRSVLGIVWSLLNPLAYLLVLTFVFQRVVLLDIPNYPLFVFTGVLAWGWFSAALPAATISITGNRELIRRPGFPVAVLPAVPVLSNFVHFGIAMSLLVAVLLASGGRPSSALLALPLVAGLQFVLTLSVGYLTAAIEVRFRDTSYMVGVALLLGFFVTPVFYQAGSIPEAYRLVYLINPMAHLINAYRDILMGERWPDLPALLAVGAGIAVLFWLGYRAFTRASLSFAEET